MPQVAPGTFKPVSPQMPTAPSAEALAMTFDDSDPVLDRDASTNGSISVEDNRGNKAPASVDVEKLPELSKEEGKAVEDGAPPKEDDSFEPEKKEEEKKPEGEKKSGEVKDYIKPPPAKKVEGKEIEEKGEKKEVITKITPLAKGTEHFDYTGYSEQEKEYLKNMSRPAREYASKLMKENRELAKVKEFNYYQAPDAYKISPEYTALQNDAYFADAEARHYAQQLTLIKQAKPFKAIESWKADGTPIFSADIAPTDQSEEQVRLAMNNCYSTANQLKSKMEEYPSRYKSSIEEATRGIENERQARFAWAADPAMMDSTVVIEGVGDVPIKKVHEDMANLFHPSLRAHPAVKVVGDMMVTFHIMKAMLNDAQKSSNINEIKVAEVKRGEPSSSTKPAKAGAASNGKWGGTDFDMGGMPE